MTSDDSIRRLLREAAVRTLPVDDEVLRMQIMRRIRQMRPIQESRRFAGPLFGPLPLACGAAALLLITAAFWAAARLPRPPSPAASDHRIQVDRAVTIAKPQPLIESAAATDRQELRSTESPTESGADARRWIVARLAWLLDSRTSMSTGLSTGESIGPGAAYDSIVASDPSAAPVIDRSTDLNRLLMVQLGPISLHECTDGLLGRKDQGDRRRTGSHW